MGLDQVELLLAVEDGFQIHIENHEAARVGTVGDLYDLVVSKLRHSTSKQCLTSAAFYRTRRGIVDSLGVPRREIRPSTNLEPLLPEATRRRMWQTIEAVVGLKLPKLKYPGSTVSTFLVIGMIGGIASAVFAHAGAATIAFAAFGGLILGGSLLRVTLGLAIAIPNGEVTVGDLARDVLALNHASLARELGGWNEKDAWETLCRIIVNQTGVDPHLITREAGIVDDLGIG
jgi:hypothetical protein